MFTVVRDPFARVASGVKQALHNSRCAGHTGSKTPLDCSAAARPAAPGDAWADGLGASESAFGAGAPPRWAGQRKWLDGADEAAMPAPPRLCAQCLDWNRAGGSLAEWARRAAAAASPLEAALLADEHLDPQAYRMAGSTAGGGAPLHIDFVGRLENLAQDMGVADALIEWNRAGRPGADPAASPSAARAHWLEEARTRPSAPAAHIRVSIPPSTGLKAAGANATITPGGEEEEGEAAAVAALACRVFAEDVACFASSSDRQCG